jgi:hypothetical protein
MMEAPPRHADHPYKAHTSPVGCWLLAPEMSAAAHVRYVGSCAKGHRIRNNSRLDLIIRVVINRLERPLRRLQPSLSAPLIHMVRIPGRTSLAIPRLLLFPIVHYSLVRVQRFVFCDINY